MNDENKTKTAEEEIVAEYRELKEISSNSANRETTMENGNKPNTSDGT